LGLILYPDLTQATMVSEKIIELRTKKGWTQAELAKRADVSQSMVANYENGLPTSKSGLQKLANAFDVPVSYLGNLAPVMRTAKHTFVYSDTEFKKLAKRMLSFPLDLKKNIMQQMLLTKELNELRETNERITEWVTPRKR
jgi:transcriptional regulator with XRE-family HTH domain